MIWHQVEGSVLRGVLLLCLVHAKVLHPLPRILFFHPSPFISQYKQSLEFQGFENLVFKEYQISACLVVVVCLVLFSHSLCSRNKVVFFFFLDENGFHLKIYCLMLLIPSNLVTVIVLLLMLVFEERHIFNGMER